MKKCFKIVYHEIERRAKVGKTKRKFILLVMIIVNVFPWWWPWE